MIGNWFVCLVGWRPVRQLATTRLSCQEYKENTHVNLWASSTSTRTGRHRLSKPARDSRFFADDAVGLRFRETVLAFFFSCHRMNALPSLRSPDLIDVQWVADPGLMSSKDCSLSALQRHGIRAAFGVSASLTARPVAARDAPPRRLPCVCHLPPEPLETNRAICVLVALVHNVD